MWAKRLRGQTTKSIKLLRQQQSMHADHDRSTALHYTGHVSRSPAEFLPQRSCVMSGDCEYIVHTLEAMRRTAVHRVRTKPCSAPQFPTTPAAVVRVIANELTCSSCRVTPAVVNHCSCYRHTRK